MGKIRETLRLHFDGKLGQRPIARCLDISRTTVGDYLCRAKIAGLGWPLPDYLSDQQKRKRNNNLRRTRGEASTMRNFRLQA